MYYFINGTIAIGYWSRQKLNDPDPISIPYTKIIIRWIDDKWKKQNNKNLARKSGKYTYNTDMWKTFLANTGHSEDMKEKIDTFDYKIFLKL